MFSFLYSLTIYPLEIAYKYVYLFFVSLTGGYIAGLVALSIINSIIFIPLKKIASSAYDKERRIQNVLVPQIKRISSESSGAVKQQRLTELYRRYGYHPIYNLRASLGIIFQVPFICAAYYMISGLNELHGKSFGPFVDLSKPDGLMFGVNLLPLLMTAFNLGAVYCNDAFKANDRLQACFIAVLFLWILYGAPSALLIYWSGNNLILLAQGLWASRRNEPGSNALLTAKVFAESNTNWLTSLFIFPIVAVAFYIIGFDGYLRPTTGNQTNIQKIDIIFWGLTLISGGIITKRYWQEKFKDKRYLIQSIWLFFAWLFFLLSSGCLFAGFLHLGDARQGLYFWGLSLFIIGWLATFLPFKLPAARPSDSWGKYNASLFFHSAAAFVILINLYIPIAYYMSDPGFFYYHFWPMILPFLLIAGFLATALAISWLVCPKKIKPYYSYFLLGTALLSLLISLGLARDFGSLSGGLFSKYQALYSHLNLAGDYLSIALAVSAVVVVAFINLKKQVINFLRIIIASLLAACALFAFSDHKLDIAQNQMTGYLPQHKEIFAFSPDKPNVLIFVLDMFTGDHVYHVFNASPELRHKFEGFTWYPDTVAVGTHTPIATPAIYGGNKYLPKNINERGGGDLLQLATPAYAVMPRNFAAKGYDVKLVGIPTPYDKAVYAKHAGQGGDAMVTWPTQSLYTKKTADELGLNLSSDLSKTKYILLASLFRISPSPLKIQIYENGRWHGSNFIFELAEKLASISIITSFSDFITTDSTKPTLKMVYSQMTHAPWLFEEDSLKPLSLMPQQNVLLDNGNGIMKYHFYSEKHALEILSRFFDDMRRLGVYDNTKIILVADHGFYDSPMLNGLRTLRDNQSALLMVKDFNSAGDVAISSNLMHTSDTLLFVCQIIGTCDEAEPVNFNDQRRERFYHLTTDADMQHAIEKFKYTLYKVVGGMDQEENWSFVERVQ